MAKRSSKTSSTATSAKVGSDRVITGVIAVILVLAAGYFLLTGSDPLGLFSSTEEPAAVSEVGGSDLVDVGSGGDWWEVHFTDPNTINDPDDLAGSIPEKLIAYIDNAEKSIHIAAFEFNLTPVAEALIAAHNRGVEVQWVTDDEHGIDADEEEGHGQFAMLEDAGIEIVDDGRSALMHNKFLVFDEETVWTGSTNITKNGNFRNNNNVLIIESPEVAEMFEHEFSEMWYGHFGPTSPSTVSKQSATVQGTPVQVLFAPEDEVMSILVPLVEEAEKRIRFMAYSFTHDELGGALQERANAGVDVKGIFELRGSETEYSELGKLFCADMAVRQDGNPGTFHHKVLVIDDKTVVTGSLNFSDNADESNDENVVVVANQDIAARYLQEFELRWAEAVRPDAADVPCE